MSIAPYVAVAVNFRSDFCQPQTNAARMADFVAQAVGRDPRTRLVVFPECATTGLPGPDSSVRTSELRQRFLRVAETVPGPTSRAIGAAAKRHKVFVAVGFVEADAILDGVIYNSSMLVGPEGELVAVHRKVHTGGIFKSGDEIRVFDTAIGRVGLSICYDLWFPEFLRLQALAGCQVHINLTANQPVFGVGSTHVPIVRAAECALYVVSANRVGDDRPQGGLAYMGASSIVAPLGEVLAMAGKEDEELVFGEIDLTRVANSRVFLPTYQSRRTDLYDIIAVRPDRVSSPPARPQVTVPDIPEVDSPRGASS